MNRASLVAWADRRVLLALLTFFSVTLLFTGLEQGGLPSYDDGYYAQKSKEMLRAGEWLTPTINGRPYFDNPPGFFWLVMASYQAFGVNEFAARLPSAMGGLLGILGTFLLFELLLGLKIGFLSAVALSLTTLYLKYARHAMIDVSVAATGVWCFYFFLKALAGRPWLYVLAGAIGSYVMLAKSAFGILPVLTLLVYLLATWQLRPFRTWQFYLGALVYGAPYALWCLSQFAEYDSRFINGHFAGLIFALATQSQGTDKWYDYFVTLGAYFPHFLLFMLVGIYVALGQSSPEGRRSHWFSLSFFFTFFIVLSLQATKKNWYLLPAFPACAALAAVGIERIFGQVSLERWSRILAGMAAVMFLAVHLTPLRLSSERAVDQRRLAPYVRLAGEQGFGTYSLNHDFWKLNNSLMFYSDRAAEPILEAELRAKLAQGEKLAVVFWSEEWDQRQSEFTGLQLIKRSGKLAVVASAPLPVATIFE